MLPEPEHPSHPHRSLPFDPEALITTKFVRTDFVDADDTIPVALFSSPYERVELEESAPYHRIELVELSAEDELEARWMRASENLVATSSVPLVDLDDAPPPPALSLRVIVTIVLLASAFAFGTAIAFLAALITRGG